MNCQPVPHFEAFCVSAMRPARSTRWRMRPEPPITRAERELAGYGMGYLYVAPAIAAATGGAAATSGVLAAAGGPIGAVIGGVIMAFQLLKGVIGPSPYNVPAAQAQQVFESAAYKILEAAKAGMILPSQAIIAMQELISMGRAQISTMGLKKPGEQAIGGLTSNIQANIASARRLPERVTRALDTRGLIINSRKLYPESKAQGSALADQILQSIAASGAGSSPSGSTPGLMASSSAPLALLAAGVVAILALS